MTSLPSSSSHTPKLWRVGTLTYTSGGLILLFCWLLWGDFAWSMRDRCVPSAVQLLFKRFGASDTLVGLLCSSLPGGIGLILGPIIGYKSDRLRSRWGRRIPFLAIPTPFIVLSMVGLVFAPQIGAFAHHLLGSPAWGLDSTVLIFMAVFWTAFELSCVSANSVFGALINDVVPQAVIGRFFGLFRALSLIAGMLLNYWIMGKIETRYASIFLGVGLLYGVGFTLMCLKVKEGAYPPPPPLLPGKAGSAWASVCDYFRDGFAKPYYLLFFGTTIFLFASTGPFNLYAVFYAQSLGLSLDAYFKCIAIMYGVSLVIAYPLGALVDRFHPLRVSLAVLALYGCVMGWGMLYVKNAASFTVVLMLHTVISGTLFTVAASLGQRLLPQSKFAEISSAGGILGSLFGMAFAPAMGAFLDRSHHDYRYVFHAGFGLAILGLILGIALYRRFLALGGPKNYHAPE